MAPVSPLYLRDEELERALELLFLAYFQLVEAGLRPLAGRGLSAKDYLLLFLLKRHPGVTVAELTRWLAASKQALSRHVIKLKAMGLLAEREGADRRTKPLVLTHEGLAVLGEALAVQRRQLKRVFRQAGPDAVAGFLSVVQGVGEERRRFAGGGLGEGAGER